MFSFLQNFRVIFCWWNKKIPISGAGAFSRKNVDEVFCGAQWQINLEIPVLVQSLKSSNVVLGGFLDGRLPFKCCLSRLDLISRPIHWLLALCWCIASNWLAVEVHTEPVIQTTFGTMSKLGWNSWYIYFPDILRCQGLLTCILLDWKKFKKTGRHPNQMIVYSQYKMVPSGQFYPYTIKETRPESILKSSVGQALSF